MPAAFDAAVKAGGRVRTIKGPNKQFGLSAGEYMHVVFKDGKMHRGEVKKANPHAKAFEKESKRVRSGY